MYKYDKTNRRSVYTVQMNIDEEHSAQDAWRSPGKNFPENDV